MFYHWPKLEDLANTSADVINLYNVIDAYNQRHNSIGSISSTINEDLRTTYDEYIRNAADLSKETFFLEILVRLLPMLNEEEVKLWLKTYLRPALDSAGFDLKFVEKSRELVLALTVDLLPTSDSGLWQRRELIAQMVMDYVLRIYMKDEKAYEMIDLNVSDTELDTHVHVERVRFVERNALAFIKDYGLKDPQNFFTFVNKFFLVSSSRLKTLSILAHLFSTNTSRFQTIVDSPLFVNLLKSLLLDFSVPVVVSGLNVLVMLVAKICNRISRYLPDILVVFTRLISWGEFKKHLPEREKLIHEYLEKSKIQWDMAGSDQEGAVSHFQLFAIGALEPQHLATLIYGLFPMNLVSFGKAPFEFLKENSPKIISVEHLHLLDAEIVFEAGGLERFVSSTVKLLCRRFMLHPNIMNQVSIEQELKNPIEWILREFDGENIGEEEVLLGCLRLNPDIVLTVPDNLVLPKRLLSRLYGTGHFGQEILERSLQSATVSLTSLSSTGGSYSSNRGSLSLADGYERGNSLGRLNLPQHLLNANRKMSIIPTNMIIENQKLQDFNGANEVKFKNVDFRGIRLEDTESLNEKLEADNILELYDAHEKLFSLGNTRANSVQFTDSTQTANGNFQQAPKTASDLLNEQLHPESRDDSTIRESVPCSPLLLGADTVVSIGSGSQGNAIDFYQRELLLMKNELEFSSYMKHLNKFNYIKLKLRLNKILREGLESASTTAAQDAAKVEVSMKGYNGLLETVKALQIEKDETLTQLKDANSKLYAQILELKRKLEELHEAFSDLSSVKSKLAALAEISKNILNEKDEHMQRLSNELQILKQKNELTDRKKEIPIELPISPDPMVKQHEKEIADLRMELRMVKEQNTKIALELEKTSETIDITTRSYEKQLARTKLDIGEAVRAQSGHYERKIQELNTAIIKYESSLEEKNARIMQLSTSKPIRIPGPMDIARPGMSKSTSAIKFRTPEALDQRGKIHDYFERDGSSVSLESNLSANLSHVPPQQKMQTLTSSASRQNLTQPIPIIRGRGGYQKRLKKLM